LVSENIEKNERIKELEDICECKDLIIEKQKEYEPITINIDRSGLTISGPSAEEIIKAFSADIKKGMVQ